MNTYELGQHAAMEKLGFPALTPLLRLIGRGAARGAGAGALTGGVTGAVGADEGNRTRGFFQGALAGGATGGLLGGAAGGIGGHFALKGPNAAGVTKAVESTSRYGVQPGQGLRPPAPFQAPTPVTPEAAGITPPMLSTGRGGEYKGHAKAIKAHNKKLQQGYDSRLKGLNAENEVALQKAQDQYLTNALQQQQNTLSGIQELATNPATMWGSRGALGAGVLGGGLAGYAAAPQDPWYTQLGRKLGLV